jgi:TRAP-type C4-dicarboxylate transport system permease small subunit
VARALFVTLPYLITGSLLLVATAINVANVIGRYLFGAAIFWTEEILVFIVIWSVFLAVPSIAYQGDHVYMDLFSARLRGPWKKLVNSAVAALFIACGVFVVVQSYRVVALHLRTGAVSVAAGVPLAIPHAALLVGFALMVLAVLFRLRAYVSGTFD